MPGSKTRYPFSSGYSRRFSLDGWSLQIVLGWAGFLLLCAGARGRAALREHGLCAFPRFWGYPAYSTYLSPVSGCKSKLGVPTWILTLQQTIYRRMLRPEHGSV